MVPIPHQPLCCSSQKEPMKPHTTIEAKVQLQDPSLRWNWDQSLLILISLCGLLFRRGSLFPSLPCAAQRMPWNPSWFSILRDGTHNTLGTAWVSHPARILCLPSPCSWNSVDPRAWEHPGRIPRWMLSPVVSKRAGRNDKKWDEDKMEISSSATDWAEGV